MRQSRVRHREAILRASMIQTGYKPTVSRVNVDYFTPPMRSDHPARSDDLEFRLARALADIKLYAAKHDVPWNSLISQAHDIETLDWIEDDKLPATERTFLARERWRKDA